jgi:hypothetical protein
MRKRDRCLLSRYFPKARPRVARPRFCWSLRGLRSLPVAPRPSLSPDPREPVPAPPSARQTGPLPNGGFRAASAPPALVCARLLEGPRGLVGTSRAVYPFRCVSKKGTGGTVPVTARPRRKGIARERWGVQGEASPRSKEPEAPERGGSGGGTFPSAPGLGKGIQGDISPWSQSRSLEKGRSERSERWKGTQSPLQRLGGMGGAEAGR